MAIQHLAFEDQVKQDLAKFISEAVVSGSMASYLNSLYKDGETAAQAEAVVLNIAKKLWCINCEPVADSCRFSVHSRLIHTFIFPISNLFALVCAIKRGETVKIQTDKGEMLSFSKSDDEQSVVIEADFVATE